MDPNNVGDVYEQRPAAYVLCQSEADPRGGGGEAVLDSTHSVVVLENGHLPVTYFRPEDVRLDLLKESELRTHCPIKGEAIYLDLKAGDRTVENAVWSYRTPVTGAEPIGSLLAFYWDKVEHWYEEDEEVFGHARDPYHRIDVRPSSREVAVAFGGETVAQTRRGLFLFETGLLTRFYIPPEDVRTDLLTKTERTSICPYKETASYWSLEVGAKSARNVVWAYLDPLPECPRIEGHFCFDPEKVDELVVEREETTRRSPVAGAAE